MLTLERTPERLTALLNRLEPVRDRLGAQARGFVDDIAARHARQPRALLLSPRQWDWLESLARRLRP
jgi:hypothetical protein